MGCAGAKHQTFHGYRRLRRLESIRGVLPHADWFGQRLVRRASALLNLVYLLYLLSASKRVRHGPQKGLSETL